MVNITSTPMYSNGIDLEKLAIVYVRVSQAREEMCSPAQQEAACRQWAERHGVHIVKIVPDLDLSGRDFAKRKVMSIIEDVRDDRAGLVLVWRYSRWGRNSELSKLHERVLNEAGGRLVAVTEEADTTTAAGKLQRGMLHEFSEFFSNLVSEGWHDTFNLRRSEGKPATGSPRFGYKRCPDCKLKDPDAKKRKFAACKSCHGVFIVDEKNASLLAEAYRLYAVENQTFRSIMKAMKEKGAISRDGNMISERSWRQILDSGFGAGLICVISDEEKKRVTRLGLKSFKKDFTTFDYLPGAHKAVITPELWEKYLARRREMFKENPAVYGVQHKLTGLLRCGTIFGEDDHVCYAALKPHKKEATEDSEAELRWRCDYRDSGFDCPGVRVPQAVALAFIKEWIIANATDEGAIRAATEKESERAKAADKLAPLITHKAKIEKKLERLNEGYMEGVWDATYVRNAKEPLEAERIYLEEQIAEQKRVRDAHVPTPREFEGLLAIWDSLTIQELNAALKSVISYVLVTSHGRKYSKEYNFELVPRWKADPIKRRDRMPASESGTQPGQ